MALGPLRTITKRLSNPSSPLEPIAVLLACGHAAYGVKQSSTRARCGSCKTALRIQQASKRVSRLEAIRSIEAQVSGIYVSRDAGHSFPVRDAKGPRVYRVMLQDVTPRAQTGRDEKPHTVDVFRVACDAQSVGYLRAELARWLAMVDGSIVVT